MTLRALRPALPRLRSALPRLRSALPWLVVGAALVGALCWTGTPGRGIAGYGLYWGAGLLLPGTLVHRALRGSRGNLPEDLGHGAVVGLLLELLAWAGAAAIGQPGLLRWWPAPVVALFLAVPGLRRHWRTAQPRPLPARWSWAMAAVLVLLVGWATARWATTPLPPVTFDYYQDLLYHLSLVQELTRGAPFQVPQLAGEPLRYHYLSDAHLASASMITGIRPDTVLLRLWVVPVAAVAAVVTAALARDLTGRWWAGPLAAGAAYVGLPLALGAPVDANGGSPVSFASPSQTYVLPFLVTLAGLCCAAARGRPLGAGWALVPALGLACAGAKASALPPLVAGLLLAAAGVAARQRRVPWRALAAVGILLAAMAAGVRLFAGGGASTLGVQAGAVLRWMPPYRQTLGIDDGIEPGGLLPPGLSGADALGWLFALGVVGWWTLMQLPRLAGLAGLSGTPLGRDPAAWLLGGAMAAGTAASWLLYHPSASQLYFLLCAAPLGVLLTVWALAAVPVPPRLLTAAFALGLGAALLPRSPTAPHTERYAVWARALAAPVGRAVLLAVAAVGLAALLMRLRRRLVRAGGPDAGSRAGARLRRLSAGTLAALLGASVAAGAAGSARTLGRGRVDAAPAGAQRLAVTAAEMRAALWLDAHADDDDVVATNVHCRPVPTRAHCDARAFWVTGLGGHRAVVESWGYTDQAVAAHARGGRSYPRQPPPDPQRFALNERAFTTPSAADLRALRQRYGVRWLFADARAGRVATELDRLATLRLVSGPVRIYELTGP